MSTITYCNYKNHDIFFCQNIEGRRSLIYAPTLRILVECSNSLISELILSIPEFEQKLPKLAPLIFSSFRKGLNNPIIPKAINKRTPSVFALSVGISRDCSLKCIYCHADAGLKIDSDPRILLASIDYVKQKIKERNLKALHVSFAVGGEPTIRWNLFKEFVVKVNALAKSLNIELYKSITTNGFYSSSKRAFICQEFDSILLSFDGPSDIQNKHRPTRSGGDSYDTVFETAKHFSQHAKIFAIRSTISSLSINRLKELVFFFLNNFGKKVDLVLEPMVKIGRGKTTTEVTSPSSLAFAKHFWQAYNFATSNNISLTTSGFNPKRIVANFCYAMSLPSFTVTTNGIVTACERDCEGIDYNYGCYIPRKGTFKIDPNRIKKNISLVNMPEYCTECICKWHCAGDCPDTRRLGYQRCDGNKYLLLKYLSKIAKESN